MIDNGGARVKAATKSYSSFYAAELSVDLLDSKLENVIVHFTPQNLNFTSSSGVTLLKTKL